MMGAIELRCRSDEATQFGDSLPSGPVFELALKNGFLGPLSDRFADHRSRPDIPDLSVKPSLSHFSRFDMVQKYDHVRPSAIHTQTILGEQTQRGRIGLRKTLRSELSRAKPGKRTRSELRRMQRNLRRNHQGMRRLRCGMRDRVD